MPAVPGSEWVFRINKRIGVGWLRVGRQVGAGLRMRRRDIGQKREDRTGRRTPKGRSFARMVALGYETPVNRHTAANPSSVPGQWRRSSSMPVRRATLRKAMVTMMASSA
jgi:hypothetical protein